MRLAIFHKKPDHIIEKLAEKYRLAHLSLLKAKIHFAREMDYMGKKHDIDLKKIESEHDSWIKKSLSEVIDAIIE